MTTHYSCDIIIGINYMLEELYLKIHESAENYLETILLLSKKQSYVRSIDIANELNFSKPSVSVAMKNLRTSGHILVDHAGHIRTPGCRIHSGASQSTFPNVDPSRCQPGNRNGRCMSH